MSVINQMLRDIEKRQSNVVAGTPHHQKKSSNTVLLILLVTVLNVLLVLAGYWVWQRVPVEQLESRNNESAQVLKSIEAGTKDKTAVTSSEANPEIQTAESSVVQQLESSSVNESLQSQPLVQNSTAVASQQNTENDFSVESAGNKSSDNQSAKTESQPAPTLPSKQSVQQAEAPKPKPTLNIEKIELSKAELLQHKRGLLAQAKANQELDKAIQYARELHQLNPQNVDDIAELAALLYAKGEFSTVEALLLSGLRYESGELKLRLMLARLFYKSGRLNNAFQVLMEMQPDVVSNLDYYVLRASLARELEKFNQGMLDYALLTQVKPNQGSWWLGYALCADAAAKVQQAIDGYKRALTTASLGSPSIKFAQQRIQVLEN